MNPTERKVLEFLAANCSDGECFPSRAGGWR